MSETGKVISLHLEDSRRHIEVMEEILEALKESTPSTD